MPRPRKFDESDVIAAARDQFWTRGYGATSVDDLTAATGLGKGSLYGAFGDKHGLFMRALDDYIATALDGVRAQLHDAQYDAYERLTRHIRWQAKVAGNDKARRGCMMARTAAELGSTDDEVERKVERANSVWRKRARRHHRASTAGGHHRSEGRLAGAGRHRAVVHARARSAAPGRCEGDRPEDRGRGDDRPHSHPLTGEE